MSEKPKDEPYSGMSNEEADRIRERVEAGPKADQYRAAAEQLTDSKNEMVKDIADGLSSQDAETRKDVATFLRKDLIPCLHQNRGAQSRADTLATLTALVAELRPPKDKFELSDLDNAVFCYILEQLHAGESDDTAASSASGAKRPGCLGQVLVVLALIEFIAR